MVKIHILMGKKLKKRDFFAKKIKQDSYNEVLKKNERGSTIVEPLCSRDDWIRTSDHTPPRRVL